MGLEDKWMFVRHFGELLASELTPWVTLVLAPPGLWRLARTRRRELELLLGVFTLNVLGLIAILRFRFDHENAMRVNEYYLPAYVALAIVLAAGATTIAERLARHVHARATGLVALVPIVPLAVNFELQDRSRDTRARELSAFILGSAEVDAIYWPSGDYSAFPALALQVVDGLRPDVLLADYTGKPSPAARRLAASLAPGVDDEAALQQLFFERTRRPMYFAAKSDVRLANVRLVPWGLVYRVVRPGERVPPAPDVLSSPVVRPSLAHATDLDRSILTDLHLMRGEAHAEAGRLDAALDEWRTAERWAAGSKEALNNLGSTLAERGLVDEAARLYRSAAALARDYRTPRRNLAALLERQGHTPEAITAWEDYLAIAPDDDVARSKLAALRAGSSERAAAEARVREYEAATRERPEHAPTWNNLGSARAEAGDAKGAIAAFERAVALDPGYALACKNLALVHERLLGDRASAERWWARHRALEDATQPDAGAR
ncbi:tetratricopeptide repeat protein [Myxococcota bacterium]|nr:tetratricopeptide repeat protein [Myxococcota bacterium]